MTEEDIMSNFMKEYNEIRKNAKLLHFTDAEIDEIFLNGLKHVKTPKSTTFTKINKIILSIVLISLVIYVLLYIHQPTSSLVLRNVQSFIYPGFKVIRNLGIPIISLFPALTALYDETCLVENPYFHVTNLDCYPCEHVHSVINLTGLSLNHSFYESGTPFVINDQRNLVFFADLVNLYQENSIIFDQNAPWMITSNNKSFKHIGNVLNNNNIQFSKDNFVHWRINRMLPARIIRKLFPRPSFITEWSGQSIERYVLIDGPKSSGYSLPSFECSYVFVVQGSGERDIILEATPECKDNCRRIPIRMKPSYILWYNWWYWKPLSLPAENSTNVSISYVSSHCL